MPKMGLVYDPVFLEHNTGSHPENAMRLKHILEALENYGIREKMADLAPEEATVEQLARFHHRWYIERVAAVAENGGAYLDPDTYVSGRSYGAAVKAAGGVIKAIDQVLTDQVNSAFALVRPPGHHAMAGRGMGFCIFNNVVVGALHAKAEYGLERILIIDWDVHHGNGTAAAFDDDPTVLYFSTHQQGHYPGTGRITEVGTGPGEGYTINIPLIRGTGDSGFYYAFTQLLDPVARQYKPQLVIISAGFDAHYADPLGGLTLTSHGFAQIAEVVKNIARDTCSGRTVLALEGGYNLKAISQAASAVINVFGEYGVQIDEPASPSADSGQPTMRIPIDEAISIHRKYWKL